MLLQDINSGEMPRLVMFDLDGTLVDSVPDLAHAVNALLVDMDSQQVPESQVRQWVGNGARKLVERALQHAGLHSEDDLEKGIHLFKSHYRKFCDVDTCLYDGVLPCLQFLQQQGVSMAIVTNKPREFVPAILTSLSIDGFFDYVIGGDDFPERKPSPMPLLACMEQFSCLPSQTVMVGDSLNDIEAARRAGIPVVAVDYGYNHGKPIEEDEPDVVLSSLIRLCEAA